MPLVRILCAQWSWQRFATASTGSIVSVVSEQGTNGTIMKCINQCQVITELTSSHLDSLQVVVDKLFTPVTNVTSARVFT